MVQISGIATGPQMQRGFWLYELFCKTLGVVGFGFKALGFVVSQLRTLATTYLAKQTGKF